MFKPLRCALLSIYRPRHERVSFSYQTGLEWILEQRKHKETVCRKVEQMEKRLKTTRAPSVTSCPDILVLKKLICTIIHQREADEALIMTNIYNGSCFPSELCCRCILKDRHTFLGGISGVSVPGAPVQVSSLVLAPCSTDVIAPPLCSVMNAVITAVW